MGRFRRVHHVWLLFWFLGVLFTKVFSIHCFFCYSKVSWEHCDGNVIKIDCVKKWKEYDICITKEEVFENVNTTYYERSCSSKGACGEAHQQCKELKQKECGHYRCCDTDYCNGSNGVGRVTLSSYLLIGVAGIQFIHYFHYAF